VRHLREFLEMQLELGKSRETELLMPWPVFIQGPPGVGKTAVVYQFAEANDLRVLDFRLAAYEPTDLTGWPYRKENGRLGYLLPDRIPFEDEPDTPPTIAFLDEFNYADADVLRAAQMFVDRHIHGRRLHPNVAIIAAGNAQGDNADVKKLATPLVSRFVWYYAKSNLEAFARWGFGKLHPLVMAYLHASTDALYVAPDERDKLFPCPRMWERVSEALHHLALGDECRRFVEGCIGKEAASAFMAMIPNLAQVTPLAQLLDGVCSDELDIQVTEAKILKTHLRMKVVDGEMDENAACNAIDACAEMSPELRQQAKKYISTGRDY